MTTRKTDLSRRALLASSIPAMAWLLLSPQSEATSWPAADKTDESAGVNGARGVPPAFTASVSGTLELVLTAKSGAAAT
ncbi:MAG: hypothetical protein AAGF23_17765 [Acidobacteriota bacterium]